MKLKNFILRGKRGWCPEDTWNLDSYLARIISETTRYLAENTNSYPYEMGKGQWAGTLKEISEGIMATEVVDDFIEELTPDEYVIEMGKAFKKRKKALKLLIDYFEDLWD